jgi:hypothetical protein
MPQLKQLARQIFHETLAAIDISATMQRKLRRKGTLLLCGETCWRRSCELGEWYPRPRRRENHWRE